MLVFFGSTKEVLINEILTKPNLTSLPRVLFSFLLKLLGGGLYSVYTFS